MADITIKPVSGPSKTERQSRVGAKRSAKTAESAASGTSDNVELTPLSTGLMAMVSNLNDAQVVDTARIETIKEAIREGRFKVNPEAVADRLIATVQELMEKKN
ncbi:MAG: flagellar biosynthesis anti-sigma factor FlgM [Sulfuricellaceae bacterium]